MDEDTARWVRVEAAKAGMSVSRYVGDLLAQRRANEPRSQAEIIAEIMARPPYEFADDAPLPTREQLYEEIYAGRFHRHERTGVREGSSQSDEDETRR